MEEMKKILVVEDEEAVRITLAANLELEDFEVVEAENGAEALEVLKAEKVDAVLSDVRMPKTTGVEMFQQIKENYPELPVILMTAFTDERDIDTAIEGGVYTILPKPFEISHVVHTLRAALSKPEVLVVDDIDSVAETLAQALSSAGLKAQPVTSGAAALEQIQSKTYDICISDLMMPEMDGIELSKQLRDQSPHMTVIIYSGQDVGEKMSGATQAGISVILRKPVKAEALLKEIANIRGKPPQTAA